MRLESVNQVQMDVAYLRSPGNSPKCLGMSRKGAGERGGGCPTLVSPTHNNGDSPSPGPPPLSVGYLISGLIGPLRTSNQLC